MEALTVSDEDHPPRQPRAAREKGVRDDMSERPDRNPIRASYWQWDPDEDEAEVEAMESALSFVRSDNDRVLIAVRGKPRRRYERRDAAWLELTDTEALRLIERLAATLNVNVR
jgi:hypothetical protein